MNRVRVLSALICAIALSLVAPIISYAASITGTGPYSGPSGFARGMGSTMYCGNNPESWVRSSAVLDTESGQLDTTVQLETNSTLAGPKGKATVNVQDARGATLAAIVSDQVGMGVSRPERL